MSTLLWIFLIGLGLIAIIFCANRDAFWSRLFGSPDLGDVDFSTLKKGNKPNEALACPPNKCPLYKGEIETAGFAASPDELLETLDQALATDRRVKRVDDGSSPRQRRYVTRSPLMRYPDTVSVEAFDAENGKSAIAMFSRAQIGYSDMGANRNRVIQWLELLKSAESKVG